MKENHTTAVLVQDQGAITGIFTSKDVVLRVIAPGLDPTNCSVVRVMTPHPDFAPMDMSIQQALRKMHDGHYLNLPVMNDSGEIVGMVDVLKLTYATLEQINTMQSADNEGPAWNKFWLSLDNETESVMSGDGSQHHTNLGSRIMSPDITRDRPGDSVAPGDSASHAGIESPPRSMAPSGRTHRLQVVAADGIAVFVDGVNSKLGSEIEAIGGTPVAEEGKISGGYALSYLDDEGDSVSITTDNDLREAIVLARQNRKDKVDLFVHDPEKPPVAVVVPVPVESTIATPVESIAPVVRERRRQQLDDEEESYDESEDEATARKSKRTRHVAVQDQVIAGVPNELLLPGYSHHFLETTAAHLRRAATVVEEVSYRGGLVLFVGTRRGQMEIVTAAAKEARACHLFTKWTPGSITNRDIILRDRFLKVVDEHDNDLAGFDRHVNQARPLLPDLVVCLNPLENYTLLYECGLANIPTIGVIDTDADPSWVTYTIPANDDSLRSIAFIAGVLGQAGKQGQKRRLADASEGTVTWRTSDDITKFISGMKARRGEILSSLIDREMVGGLSQSAVSEENEALLKRVAEDDVASEEFSKEEKELIKELAANTREMDALSEEESRLLDSFTVPKGTAEEQVNEKIMSKVGVKKAKQLG
ncbi:unnamed protein product [Parascedosporium putredinis]|uniref:CBS domain-containing protein n=1 Tax=Parascedosporium putredinis TaxID=1442378 RepID=A0A9P1H2D1_9PEZI|nr:unnamed protein product [Parascedosporium putredinis]CAI7994816.1 unnamed protein product [Parascedosporium putredinis]